MDRTRSDLAIEARLHFFQHRAPVCLVAQPDDCQQDGLLERAEDVGHCLHCRLQKIVVKYGQPSPVTNLHRRRGGSGRRYADGYPQVGCSRRANARRAAKGF